MTRPRHRYQPRPQTNPWAPIGWMCFGGLVLIGLGGLFMLTLFALGIAVSL